MYGEETASRYEYDYNAKGQVARVRDNLLNRTTQSEYDLANRPVRVKTAEAGQNVYTGQVAYDNVYGNLSEFAEKVGENRQEFGTKFGYDDENRPTSLTYSASGKEIGQSTTTIDKLNRTTFSAVKLGSKTFTSEYHFAAGGYGTGSVTNLVSSITQPGCNCGYGYDDNGNIASATLNGKWTGYTYDALGQLVQVNDRSDTRAGDNGSTWVYEYDRGGNILSKKLYPYENTSGEPLQTTCFSYGNANWKDQLTAVDGTPITYDQIGNPLSDGKWQYTWENGRQLARMQSDNVDARFVYNESGLRVQKIVNGVVTKYTLHGKNVVHMTRGSDELHFFYDAQNKPAVVVFNGTAYAYLYNQQDDVIGLLDSNGTHMVSYTYDAWGKPISKTGTLASTLGTINPFRYRGYVYDEEAGFYYASSRYYDPEISRFINADDTEYLGADGSVLSYNLFAYCMNDPVNRFDVDGNWSLPNWAKIAIGAAAIAVGVIATVATGGAAVPVLVASLKIAATSAAIGAVSGAGISAVNHRVSTGSWEGAGKRYYDPEISRFINADDTEYLGADGSVLSYNLFAYCMNDPVNRFDVDGNWSLPNWAKIAIGAAAIAVGVIATVATGGAAVPVLVASLKIAATSAAIGAVSGAGISAVNHRVSTGSWEGAGKAAVTGAIDGACDGFMWGGITAGASFTTVAAKGIKVKEIGKLKPSNKPGDGYSGVKYQAPKANGKYTTKSIELHSPHKSGPHDVWHWQQNTWNPYNNSITGSAKHWTIWGKPL